MNLDRMTMAELYELSQQIKDEERRRRDEFIERTAATSTMPKEKRRELAMAGRSAFTLPLVDWAAVLLEDREIDRENQEKYGLCARLKPLIDVRREDQTDEYKDLFEERWRKDAIQLLAQPPKGERE